MVLVILIGGTLFLTSWTWAAVGLSLFLFVVARPLSVLVGLAASGTAWKIRGLSAWFGVRGVGSLYYLMFAIKHGLPETLALQLIQLTQIVVTLSILLHGTSVKPMLGLFWKRARPVPDESPSK
jgi:NhaP-type Na+/H+ or K+/H+ antiporter